MPSESASRGLTTEARDCCYVCHRWRSRDKLQDDTNRCVDTASCLAAVARLSGRVLGVVSRGPREGQPILR